MLGRGDRYVVEVELERRDEAVAVGEQLRQRAEVELVVQCRAAARAIRPGCRRPGSRPRRPRFRGAPGESWGAAHLPWSRARNCTLHRPCADPPGTGPWRPGSSRLVRPRVRAEAGVGDQRHEDRPPRRSGLLPGPGGLGVDALDRPRGGASTQYAGYLWPMGPIFALLHWIGLSAWVSQRHLAGPDLRGLGVGGAAPAGRVRRPPARRRRTWSRPRSTCSTPTR